MVGKEPVADRFERTDFTEEDMVVGRTPDGLGFILPTSARRLSGEPLEVFAEMQRRGALLQQLEGELDALAVTAREVGLSWSLIGAAVGLTAEGARQRYGS
jgi:hypothetical protein